jgi:hypothetical protein
LADAIAGSNAMTKSAVEMDVRIAAAFTDGATSDDVSRLLTEVEAAVKGAETAAEAAWAHAWDPLVARDDMNHARRQMEEEAFRRDRLSEAARRLGERLVELKALEKASAQRAEHERVSAERDRLAAEMERIAEPIAEIAALVAQIDAWDREIRNINATTGLALGHIRHILARAAPVIATLLGDWVVWDAFIAVAALRSPPVVSRGAGAKDKLHVKRSASSPATV